MHRTLEAIYEKGILRPLQPVDLRENQRVTLTITEQENARPGGDWLDVEYLQSCAGEADESLTLEAVHQALSKIPGSLTDDFVAERDDR
jgi:predicted DNA-binding antitoxin AbrB/MazE fold protein